MLNLLEKDRDIIEDVNGSIDSFMLQHIDEAAKISPYYEQLWRDMYRLIRSGGKRLRPKMTVRAYETFGGTDRVQIIPIAAAQELLHLSLLVHDDIIDRDYVRYGVDNITGRYDNTYYKLVSDDSDRLHYAQSAALLAGDLLLSSSYRIMLESSFDASLLLSVQKIHSNSIYEVAGGELIDTEAAFRLHGTFDAKTVAIYKTASYTFKAPLLIGATLAGVSDEVADHLKIFAQNLGVAYQLRDDVIGVFGDEKKIGKTTMGDIREGKYTYMVEQFYAHATTKERLIFDQYFGNKDVSRSEVQLINKLLVSSGALQRTENEIERYARQALDQLEKMGLHESSELHELVQPVTKRDK